MKKTSETILFFGSGPVASESLRLLAANFSIEAIITKPAPSHHKGTVPVLEAAQKLQLPVLTATDRTSLDKLFASTTFKSRIGLLIDFGVIVSPQVIHSFPLGIVNSHFSLLPEWRGADPITFAILSGQKQTGVSLMLLSKGLDEGPVLAYAPYELSPDITTPELTKDLVQLSCQQIKAVLPLYMAEKVQAVPQSRFPAATYSRKLSKQDGVLDFSKPAIQLEREVRAFLEWPKSRTTFGSLEVIVTKARVVSETGKPGDRTIIDRLPVIYCGEHALALEKLKPAGKPEMSGAAFLAGYKQLFSLEN